ncbi:hypothetical protein PM082_018041 [Marasmius tenuissimus]|nr:hypothetical protein PM082_018041 [Marasmius tenuissimus]
MIRNRSENHILSSWRDCNINSGFESLTINNWMARLGTGNEESEYEEAIQRIQV